MLFNSLNFIAFFFIVLLFLVIEQYTTKRTAARNTLLLIASYIFYGWFDIGFLLVLFYVTIVNFVTGRTLLKATKNKKTILGVGTMLSLLPLLFYKYAAFVTSNICMLLGTTQHEAWFNGWIMPIGISFFTFQALSYSIDIYRGKITASSSLLDFMLFVAFFPTVLSGPIEKARNLLPQINCYRKITIDNFIEGAITFIWGLFKKIVIADRLCAYVDWAYGSADYLSGSTLALAAILYSIQIYCDFSGYSDMAWGVAKALGFDVTRNFRFPYFATTIKEFWRRWHISLTSWFTEYVYFSLGGNRVRLKARWMFNISMVFVLSGIWHGASWNFLIWGMLHALLYLTEYSFGIHRKGYETPRIMKIPACILVFILVTVAWIFFRIENFDNAVFVISKIVTDIVSPISTGASAFTFVCNMLLLVIFITFDWLLYKNIFIKENRFATPGYANITWVITLLLFIALFSVSADNFVYFQF